MMLEIDLSKVKLTSAKWQEIFPKIEIRDPDGWDRKNFDYSWGVEEITREEYESRLVRSTCVFRK